MKKLIGHDVGSVTFDAVGGTVTFAGVELEQEQLLLVTNATRGVILYNFASAPKGGVLVGGVLTLTVSTAGMADTDALQVYADLPEYQPATEAKQDQIAALAQEIKTLSDTMLYFTTAMLDKMPLLDNRDSAMVNITGGSTTVAGTVPALGTLNNLNGGNVALLPYQLGAGAFHIYNQIAVTP